MNTTHYAGNRKVDIEWSPTHREQGVRCRIGSIGKKRVAVVHEAHGEWFGTSTVTREHRLLSTSSSTIEIAMRLAGDAAAADFIAWKDSRKEARATKSLTNQPLLVEEAGL